MLLQPELEGLMWQAAVEGRQGSPHHARHGVRRVVGDHLRRLHGKHGHLLRCEAVLLDDLHIIGRVVQVDGLRGAAIPLSRLSYAGKAGKDHVFRPANTHACVDTVEPVTG